MKEVKIIYIVQHSHTNLGSHRSSDGFKYHYSNTKCVVGPYFSEKLEFTYQDLEKIESFNREIKEIHYHREEDYDYGDSYESDKCIDIDESDFGFCNFFNSKFAEKYDIKFIKGKKNDCSYTFEDISAIKTELSGNLQTYNQARDYAKKKLEKQIFDLKNKIYTIEEEIKALDSEENIKLKYLEIINNIIKKYPPLFDVDSPVFENLYPLDIAIKFKEEQLIDEFVKREGCKYFGPFNPRISARLGDFQRCFALMTREEIQIEDVKSVFDFLAYLPDEEFYIITSNGEREIYRNGKLIASEDVINAIIKGLKKCVNGNYNYTLHSELSKYLISNLLEKKENDKAIEAYYWLHRLGYDFDEYEMLKLSFIYGNVKFISSFNPRDLIFNISEPAKYSYYYKKLVPDSFGDKLCLKWEFEPYVTEENIGKELYSYIKGQIDNNSASYIL